MASNSQTVLYRTPFIDPTTNLVSREWVRYFQTISDNVATTLIASNNLSDLTNITTARNNLGLGSSATESAAFFLQAAHNLSDIVNQAAAQSNLGLGSAATESTAFFLQAANNLSDLVNQATARLNLGLGTAATHAATDFAQLASANVFTGTPQTMPALKLSAGNIEAASSAGSLSLCPNTIGTDPQLYIGGSSASVNPDSTVVNSDTTKINSTNAGTNFLTVGSAGFNVPIVFNGSLGGMQTWTPSAVGSGGMTIGSITVATAEYVQIGPLCWFHISLSFTLGGTASTDIGISPPLTAVGSDFTALYANGSPSGGSQQNLMGFISSVGGNILLRLSPIGNWPLGATQARISGVYRVL